MSGAAQANVTDKEHVFIGEDRTLIIAVDDGTVGSVPGGMDTWTIEWFLRMTPEHPRFVLHKLPTAVDEVTGDVTIDIVRADSVDSTGKLLVDPGTYHHALVRTDGAAWEVLSEGTFVWGLSAGR